MKNVGKIDMILRLLLGIVLLVVGLFVLGGNRGNIIGIAVALSSALPFYIASTRSCPVFSLFKINSLSKKEKASVEKNKSK